MEPKKIALVLGMCVVSGAAHASRMDGLGYLLGFGFLFALWPLALPAFFIKGYPSPARSYVVLVGMVFATAGFIQLPISLLGTAASWWGVPDFAIVSFALGQLLTVVLSVLLIRKYGMKVALAFDADVPSAH